MTLESSHAHRHRRERRSRSRSSTSNPGKYPEDLLDLNPYHTTPTLIDRDLVLYDSRVIMEYLDERFPHPPLMPVDPVSRARARLALYQIEHDWYDLARKMDAQPQSKDLPQLRKELRDNVLGERGPVQGQAVLPVRRVLDGGRDHRAHPVAPAALRDRPAAAGAAHPQVRGTIFSRPAFRASLSENEREMRLA
jgi:RNA polymerase-associated protein